MVHQKLSFSKLLSTFFLTLSHFLPDILPPSFSLPLTPCLSPSLSPFEDPALPSTNLSGVLKAEDGPAEVGPPALTVAKPP